MAELQSHGRVSGLWEDMLTPVCRFLHPFIPVAHHPAVSSPGLAASCAGSDSVLAESFIHQGFSSAALVT